jgi:hypothetical protein
MLDLRNILQLVNHRFNDGPLSGQELVSQSHELVFHVQLGLGEELNA